MHIAPLLRHIHDSCWKSARFCSDRATDDSSPDVHLVAESQASPVQKRMGDQRKRRVTEPSWRRLSCENSNSQARDFGLPGSPNLPFRGTDSCSNWHWGFAVEFCCNTRSSTFPRPNGNTSDAIPWNPCAESCEQTTESGANKAYPTGYSSWVVFVLHNRG